VFFVVSNRWPRQERWWFRHCVFLLQGAPIRTGLFVSLVTGYANPILQTSLWNSLADAVTLWEKFLSQWFYKYGLIFCSSNKIWIWIIRKPSRNVKFLCYFSNRALLWNIWDRREGVLGEALSSAWRDPSDVVRFTIIWKFWWRDHVSLARNRWYVRLYFSSVLQTRCTKSFTQNDVLSSFRFVRKWYASIKFDFGFLLNIFIHCFYYIFITSLIRDVRS
jgi:hypothetical protein